MWNDWVTLYHYEKQGKGVGVMEECLNIHHMQEDKFVQAEMCVEHKETGEPEASPLISSQQHPAEVQQSTGRKSMKS